MTTRTDQQDLPQGFIVSGHIGSELNAENARTIPVLADDVDIAIDTVRETYPGFVVLGYMSETMLRAHLQELADLRAAAPA